MRSVDRRTVIVAIIVFFVVGLGLGYLAGEDFRLEPIRECDYQCRFCEVLQDYEYVRGIELGR